PVRFADGLATLLKEPDCLLLEVGPGQALSTFARRHPHRSPEQRVLSSLRHPHETLSDTEFLLNTLGRLWLSGVPIDWSRFHRHDRRLRLSLPTYPFERQRYWVEPAKRSAASSRSLIKKPDVTDWFYAPTWKRSIPFELGAGPPLAGQQFRWLVFDDCCGVGSSLVDRLRQVGQTAVTVKPGKQFARLGAQEYAVNPQRPEDYAALLKELVARGHVPEKIVHLWTITPQKIRLSDSELFQSCQERGFYSLLLVAQALAKNHVTASVHIGVVSNGLHLLNGDEQLYPAKATVLGACKSIPQEYPNIRCKSIDIVFFPCAAARPLKLS